jgi:tetratricopeptide (TPR) repeat protein
MKIITNKIIPKFIVAFLFHSNIVFAQESVLFHGLKQGQYNVGYKTNWVFDYQRTWDNGPRPIRMNIWYPAEKSNQNKMLFERYVLSDPPNMKWLIYRDLLRRRDIGDSTKSLKGLYSGSEELYESLLTTPTNAVENASPLNGKFPVVVYSLGQNDYSEENTILFEYLASNGFIVIAVPQVGISSRKANLMIDDELSFETQVRDLEFAISKIYTLSYADDTKVAAAGMSMGGVYALLAAMRNNTIRLLIGLDPSFIWTYESYGYKYWNSKYYDEWNLKIPMVILQRADTGEKNDYTILDKLKFSKREVVKYPNLIHSDFTSYPMFTANAPKDKVDKYALGRRNQQIAIKGYQEICQTVLKALRKYLYNNPDEVITDRKGALQLSGIQAPNEEEFCKIIQKEGISTALQVYTQASAKYPADTIIRLKKLNRIGFEYYLDKNYKMAIGIYTLCTRAYPGSSDAFENLGEMYLYNGDEKEALKNFKKSLELDPNNKDAQQMLNKLNKQSL